MSTAATETAPPSRPPVDPVQAAFGVRPPRDHMIVQAELTAAIAQFVEWERVNTEYAEDRKFIIAENKQLVAAWAAKHPGRSLAPHRVPGTTPEPPPDSPVGLKFYKLHYTIRDLQAELEAAKKIEGRA